MPEKEKQNAAQVLCDMILEEPMLSDHEFLAQVVLIVMELDARVARLEADRSGDRGADALKWYRDNKGE